MKNPDGFLVLPLTLSRRRPLSYRNQSTDNDLRLEKVKIKNALAWLKKKRGIKCEKLGDFIVE